MMVLVIFMIPTKVTHLTGINLVSEKLLVSQKVPKMVVAASGAAGLVLIHTLPAAVLVMSIKPSLTPKQKL